MLFGLVLFPAFCGLLLLLIQNVTLGRFLLLISTLTHCSLSLLTWLLPLPDIQAQGWFALDEIGRYFLSITSILFFTVSIYTNGYIKRKILVGHTEVEHTAKTESIFLASLLFFLSTLTLVTVCQQLEMLWVAIEATTLASAPLIYFHKSPHSLEATWKYIMITSFGIALALLGNFFLSHAIVFSGGTSHSLLLSQLLSSPLSLNPLWLKIAVIFLFVGYGTKMGLVPMHTWLPDAHSEAPALVSALLSGSSLNAAFLGMIRTHQLCVAGGFPQFSQNLFIGFGLLSMGFAGILIIKQKDFKRLLAYSSVEHMGILAVSIGLGGQAVFGGLFHLLHHSLIKSMLFLLAGNILIVTRTKNISELSGLLKTLPYSGPLILLGFLAISGFPPFGLFTSEFLILKSSLMQSRWVISIFFLLFLVVIFFGTAPLFLKILFGNRLEKVQHIHSKQTDNLWSVVPPLLLALLFVLLGPSIPPFLSHSLAGISLLLGGNAP